MNVLRRARAFAEEKHAEQTYDGGSYVRNHLDRVVEVLTRFDVTSKVQLTAGYLHDTLEDTHTTQEELEREFGGTVAHLVRLLTDMDGANRRERQAKTYARMRSNEHAIQVKLADRIANVEASLHTTGKSFFGMYRKEYDFFKAALYVPGAHEEMWKHLDELIASDWIVRFA